DSADASENCDRPVRLSERWREIPGSVSKNKLATPGSRPVELRSCTSSKSCRADSDETALRQSGGARSSSPARIPSGLRQLRAGSITENHSLVRQQTSNAQRRTPNLKVRESVN